MRDEQKQFIVDRVKEAGKRMEGRLPSHPSHPNGRIPTAHIYSVIKSVMGVPAKMCRSCRFHDIIEIIEYCERYAEVMDVSSALKDKYPPEPPTTDPITLDDFFLSNGKSDSCA